ncbi:MAG: glycosyltransferase family 4 protein [Flavobacteriales bacterium]|nr:glycosyltransferase family 4 protein [Flavobacteriales bacterium]
MPSKYSGASEEVFIRMARLARQRGHEVLFSVPFLDEAHPYLESLRTEGVGIHFRFPETPRAKWKRIPQKIFRSLRGHGTIPHDWFLFLKAVQEFRPDLIFVNEGMVFQSAFHKDVWFILEKSSQPVCIFNHGHDDMKIYPTEVAHWLKENYLSRIRRMYFLSRANLEAAELQMAQSMPNAVVVRNMCKLFHESPLPFPAFPLKMATISRFDARVKGHHLLLKALSEPAIKRWPWHLSIYGYGPDEALIRAWIEFLGLQEKVRICGEAQDIRKVFQEHHVFLLPSLMEGLPQSVLEASLLGRPSLVTPVGESPFLVQDGVTGFVAPGIGVPALRMALQRLMQTPPETLEKMGLAAAEHVQKFIDPEPWVTLLDDLLTLVPGKETLE